ncbi:hypothetical protein F2Q70_00033796 [Brassica cretica]|uniref:Glabrous enhancer-binding protein-like DBD domain-containing protein n=1 Tax=Brassica cretica TaxID=69181 RepID=A0A8S9JTZ2_BRACR|nr:hypothetical protein F2Q68_00028676 [Brassica cretica]KAF2585259.1 hypothetical protein F2Q70_00033796 [Brassica cretica]
MIFHQRKKKTTSPTLLPPPSLQSPGKTTSVSDSGEVSAAPSEGTSKETNSKQAKKDDEKRDTWNSPYDNDEIAVLQGMIDFKKDTGNSPYDDTNAYYDYIKKSISIEDLMGWLLSPTACRKRESRREEEKRACHAIGLISITRRCRGLLVEARVVPALVDLFRDGDEKGKILAGNALEIIAAQTEYIKLVTEAGSIPLYVELLSGRDSMGKDIAEDVFCILECLFCDFCFL